MVAEKVESRHLENAIKQFSRIRDYHFHNSEGRVTSYPRLIILNSVAAAINATLIAEEDICNLTNFCGDKNKNAFYFPRIALSYSIAHISHEPAYFLWRKFYSFDRQNTSLEKYSKLKLQEIRKIEYPEYIFMTDFWLNYLYCAVPKKLKTSLWTFTLFTDPFDRSTWIALTVSFVIVAVILITASSQNRDVLRTILILFCATLQLGAEPSPRFSGLLLLWMAISMILVCFYSGEITSEVISPPPDDVMTKIQELYDNNFTLYFSRDYVRKSLQSSVAGMRPFLHTRRTLEFFLNNSVLSTYSVESFAELCLSNQRFIMDSWQNTLNLKHFSNIIIPAHATSEEEKARRCHVGQELFRVDEQYLVILPPGNSEVTQALLKLCQAGIVERWNKEIEGMLTSSRVQERVRILGPTKVKIVEDTTLAPMKLQGKSKTVFILWMICFQISLVAFVSEIIFLHATRTCTGLL